MTMTFGQGLLLGNLRFGAVKLTELQQALARADGKGIRVRDTRTGKEKHVKAVHELHILPPLWIQSRKDYGYLSKFLPGEGPFNYSGDFEIPDLDLMG